MSRHAWTRHFTPGHATGLLLLTYAGILAAEAPAAAECGRQRELGRVVGGSAARPGEWPWQVSLQLRGQHFCGGTLVTPQWVLSAAHCFQGPNGSRAEPRAWRAVVGRLRLEETGGQERTVVEVVVHEDYHRVEGGHDLALVRLESPVALGPRVGTICLPRPHHPFAFGAPCWVTGWGNVAENVSLPAGSPLQKVALDLLSPNICNCLHSRLRQRELGRPAGATMVCAGGAQGGKGACQADSGGPVACGGAGGRWVQAGVLSFAVGCARPNGPVLATGLAAHARWLRRRLPHSAFAPPGPPPPPGLEDGKCLGCGMWGGPALEPPPGPHWPWSVSLMQGGRRRCGGALVAEEWVLTAAHCFIGRQDAESWTAEASGGSLRRGGSRLHLHGAYVGPGGGPDLALLRLEPPLNPGPGLRPLCLPYGHHRPPPGTRCWAILANNGSSDPEELLTLEVTLSGSCGDDETLCVTLPEGSPACQPDGGSPLACEERGVWFLLGTAGEGGCARGGPPLFTPMAPHERWVMGVTREAYFAETPPEPPRDDDDEEEDPPGFWGDPSPTEDSRGGPKPSEDPGVREPPETTEEPGIWGGPNPTGNPGIREPPETTEEPGIWGGPKPSEDPGVREPPETTEEPRIWGGPNPTGDPGIREPPETTKEPGIWGGPNPTGDPGIREPPETTEEPGIWGGPKPSEDPGVREPPETTKEPRIWGDPNIWRQAQVPQDPEVWGLPPDWGDPGVWEGLGEA